MKFAENKEIIVLVRVARGARSLMQYTIFLPRNNLTLLKTSGQKPKTGQCLSPVAADMRIGKNTVVVEPFKRLPLGKEITFGIGNVPSTSILKRITSTCDSFKKSLEPTALNKRWSTIANYRSNAFVLPIPFCPEGKIPVGNFLQNRLCELLLTYCILYYGFPLIPIQYISSLLPIQSLLYCASFILTPIQCLSTFPLLKPITIITTFAYESILRSNTQKHLIYLARAIAYLTYYTISDSYLMNEKKANQSKIAKQASIKTISRFIIESFVKPNTKSISIFYWITDNFLWITFSKTVIDSVLKDVFLPPDSNKIRTKSILNHLTINMLEAFFIIVPVYLFARYLASFIFSEILLIIYLAKYVKDVTKHTSRCYFDVVGKVMAQQLKKIKGE